MIPLIDVSVFTSPESDAAAATAEKIDHTLCDLGFFRIVGHGVDPVVKARYFDAMHEFFALPTSDKERLAIANSTAHRGYVGFATEALEGALAGELGDAPGDLKETLDTGIEQGPDHPEVIAGTPLHGPNQLPDIEGFRDAWQAYFDAAAEAVRRVEVGLAMGLGLPSNFFANQPGEAMHHLRMIHYPPMDRVTPEPGQLGCGAHTDYGTLTVLADDGVGGLQVQTRGGDWIDVAPNDGELVVNIGDLMAIWTNDRWVSNPHRVVNPAGVDRYSSPLFVTPPFHLSIEALPSCVPSGERPRHSPMVSGEYLLGRFDGTHTYRQQD